MVSRSRAAARAAACTLQNFPLQQPTESQSSTSDVQSTEQVARPSDVDHARSLVLANRAADRKGREVLDAREAERELATKMAEVEAERILRRYREKIPPQGFLLC